MKETSLTKALIDITQRIRHDMPVWPGDTQFSIEPAWEISEDCPVLVSKLTLSAQTGTHADAHAHFSPDGQDMASTSLAPFLGRCSVVQVDPELRHPVEPEEVLDQLQAGPPSRVLIRTFEQFPHQNWPDHFRAISPALIDVLGERGCQLIGTDAPSVDPQESKTMDAHHRIHYFGMAILEGLVLDRVDVGAYELIALPLPIVGADASPIRAVLRPLMEPKKRFD